MEFCKEKVMKKRMIIAILLIFISTFIMERTIFNIIHIFWVKLLLVILVNSIILFTCYWFLWNAKSN